jgi:hypothetical protein
VSLLSGVGTRLRVRIEVDDASLFHDPKRRPRRLGQPKRPIRCTPQGSRDASNVRIGGCFLLVHTLFPVSISLNGRLSPLWSSPRHPSIINQQSSIINPRCSAAKVVFPAPFGPAMMTILSDCGALPILDPTYRLFHACQYRIRRMDLRPCGSSPNFVLQPSHINLHTSLCLLSPIAFIATIAPVGDHECALEVEMQRTCDTESAWAEAHPTRLRHILRTQT